MQIGQLQFGPHALKKFVYVITMSRALTSIQRWRHLDQTAGEDGKLWTLKTSNFANRLTESWSIIK